MRHSTILVLVRLGFPRGITSNPCKIGSPDVGAKWGFGPELTRLESFGFGPGHKKVGPTFPGSDRGLPGDRRSGMVPIFCHRESIVLASAVWIKLMKPDGFRVINASAPRNSTSRVQSGGTADEVHQGPGAFQLVGRQTYDVEGRPSSPSSSLP